MTKESDGSKNYTSVNTTSISTILANWKILNQRSESTSLETTNTKYGYIFNIWTIWKTKQD